jgi:hypothetical protein
VSLPSLLLGSGRRMYFSVALGHGAINNPRGG